MSKPEMPLDKLTPLKVSIPSNCTIINPWDNENIYWFDFIYEVKRLSKEYLYFEEEKIGRLWDAHFLTKDDVMRLTQTKFIMDFNSRLGLGYLSFKEVYNMLQGSMLCFVSHHSWDALTIISNIDHALMNCSLDTFEVFGHPFFNTDDDGYHVLISVRGIKESVLTEMELRRLSLKIGLFDTEFMELNEDPVYENSSIEKRWKVKMVSYNKGEWI